MSRCPPRPKLSCVNQCRCPRKLLLVPWLTEDVQAITVSNCQVITLAGYPSPTEVYVRSFSLSIPFIVFYRLAMRTQQRRGTGPPQRPGSKGPACGAPLRLLWGQLLTFFPIENPQPKDIVVMSHSHFVPSVRLVFFFYICVRFNIQVFNILVFPPILFTKSTRLGSGPGFGYQRFRWATFS